MITEEFLLHNRQILDMPMDIINLFHNNNITYSEAETILDVVRGMVRDKQCEDSDIIPKVEKINWDNFKTYSA